MSESEVLIHIAAVILMLFVIGVQGFMVGNLLTRKLLEFYDVYIIRMVVPKSLCCCGDMAENHNAFNSNHSVVYAVDYGIENARKWERG